MDKKEFFELSRIQKKEPKYSESFERDWAWYVKWKDTFNFDGKEKYIIKKYVLFKGDEQKIVSESNFKKNQDSYRKYYDTYSVLTENVIYPDGNGKSAKECFFQFDSNGVILPCREPELLYDILKCKGSVNLNILMWANDRASGVLSKLLFDEIIKEFDLLDWMIKAVEEQKFKYYPYTK